MSGFEQIAIVVLYITVLVFFLHYSRQSPGGEG